MGGLMNAPCWYGMKCPYKAYDEEGDILCGYPILAKDLEDGTELSYAEDTYCQLIDDTLLADILMVYGDSPYIEKLIHERAKEIHEENDRLVQEIRQNKVKNNGNDI